MSSGLAIVLGSFWMSLMAMVGASTLLLPPRLLQQLLMPWVSLAAGTLLGGALFHMLPEGFAAMPLLQAAAWLAAGFTAFLALEIFMHWHHSHRKKPFALVSPSSTQSQSLPFLILLGDTLHNLVCGLGVTSTFLIQPTAGIAVWLAAVAHEIPQEFGDFGLLLHSGWTPRRALFWNFISALTFPVGALLAWNFQHVLPLAPVVLFAAGNYLYIAASDLVPEIKAQVSLQQAMTSFGWFLGGLLLLWRLASA